jgi:hypothetical protein
VARIHRRIALRLESMAMLASISAATGVSFAILMRTNRAAQLASAA